MQAAQLCAMRPAGVCWQTVLWAAALPLLGVAADPQSPVWPLQFHATLFQNRTGNLALVDLWYDWPNGRNLHIIHKQMGPTIFDLELNNGSQYVWFDNIDACKTIHQPVGILPPDWLSNATYLGIDTKDAFSVDSWTKAPWPTKDRMFIQYYADTKTGLPVLWEFLDHAQFHVLSFDLNRTLAESKWQPPVRCHANPVQSSLEQETVDNFIFSPQPALQ